MNGAYGNDPEDAQFVPNPSQFEEDEEEFDIARHMAEFQEKQERVLKARAAEHDAKVEGRKLEKEPENLVINGIAIPEVTPDEPEYLVDRVPVQDATEGGLMNMPYQSSKQFKAIKRINPNCITPEKRASLIAEARKAVAEKQAEMDINKTVSMLNISPEDTAYPVNVVEPYDGATPSFMDRVQTVQQKLESDETIIGFEMKDGHLVITLE